MVLSRYIATFNEFDRCFKLCICKIQGCQDISSLSLQDTAPLLYANSDHEFDRNRAIPEQSLKNSLINYLPYQSVNVDSALTKAAELRAMDGLAMVPLEHNHCAYEMVVKLRN